MNTPSDERPAVPNGRRLVLGPEPGEGWIVLLTDGAASEYLAELDALRAVKTMGDFLDEFDDHFELDEFDVDTEDPDEVAEFRAQPFDPDQVPGLDEDSWLNPRTRMVDDLSDVEVPNGEGDMWDLLGNLVEVIDNMGGQPMAYIDEPNEAAVRERLVAAGFEVVGWPG